MFYFDETKRSDGATEIRVRAMKNCWLMGVIVKSLHSMKWNIYRMGVPGRETFDTIEEAKKKFYEMAE